MNVFRIVPVIANMRTNFIRPFSVSGTVYGAKIQNHRIRTTTSEFENRDVYGVKFFW